MICTYYCEDKRSPRRLKIERVNTTPIKNVTTNDLKRRMPTGQVPNEPATLSTPDLRLEAKMIAEVSLPHIVMCFSIIAVPSVRSWDLSHALGHGMLDMFVLASAVIWNTQPGCFLMLL